MNITCDQCNHIINLPAEEVRKVPPGKQAYLTCPKCGRKFAVSFGTQGRDAAKDQNPQAPLEETVPEETAPEKTVQETDAGVTENLFGFVEDEDTGSAKAKKREEAPKEPSGKKEILNDVIGSDVYDASDKPFDFVEEEGKTALVCETDPKLKEPIVDNLNLMEYHITEVENSRSALKKMRYHVYDVVVVNESFDTASPDSNVVLIYLERLSMTVRRNIFVAMLSKRFRTMDNMVALQKSVDIVINNKNINDVGKILSRGVTDKDFFYRAFKDTLLSAGA